jgi:hypothetical protein
MHTCYAAPMPCRVNSHMPCRAPAILRQCRVLCEIPRGSRKYPNCQSYSLTTFVELCVVAGRSRMRAGRPRAVSGRPMLLIHTCHAHAALCCGLEKSLSERHGRGMVRTLHGIVNQTRPHCVNQWERHAVRP